MRGSLVHSGKTREAPRPTPAPGPRSHRNTIPNGPTLVYDPQHCMDQEPNLKVTDRRHFTAEGELKADASPTPSVEGEAKSAGEASPVPNDGPADQPVSFSSFVISLGTQAADFLGGEHKDLAAARQMISALEMLKDKSEGRRTDDETRIIEAILFDLRLAFVGAAKGSRS